MDTGELGAAVDPGMALESDNVPSSSTAMGRIPLAFHPIHGENVRLSNNGRLAKRVESFCKVSATLC